MQKKIFAWAMSMAVAAMITCSGCAQSGTSTADTANGTAQTTTLDETENNVSGQSLSAIQSGTAGVTTDEDDLCDSYDSFDAEIALEDACKMEQDISHESFEKIKLHYENHICKEEDK